MSLEDISTLYAEDLAVTADEENVRHPDKICEHTEEIRKLTGEIRVLSQLMAQMMRKIELREGVDGQTVVLLKLQIDRMGANLQDLRKIVAETMPQVEKKRENDSMQIREFVQVVKELKEEISARPNESPTEFLQVVKELKEEISARQNEHVQVVKGLKEEISARPNVIELIQVVKELKEEISARPNDSPTELLQVVKELKEEMAALRNFPRRNDSHDYQLMFGAGTRHPPSEDSDYMESIVNITSFYPESSEGVKLTNFEEEMKIQQDSEVSKGTCSEQLPTDASVEVALAKNEDDSGVITNNTKEDNVKIINCIPETVKDYKFANFQEEMQGELDNGMANKGTELLLANESVEDSPALENRKSVVTNNTKDNVELSTLNPETAGGEMQGELDNRMVHKESSVQVKESVKDSTAKTVQVKESVEDATAKTIQVKESVEDAIAKMVQVKESVEDATAKTVQVKENVEDATDKGDGKSVILNKDTDEDNDVKLANSQEIILSQLNDKRVEKVAEQLPTKESDEDIEERNQDDSVAITKITENDTFKNSSVCLESEEDAKLAILQHEMQSKLDGSEVNKVTDKLATDERKDDAPAMEDGDFVVLNENIKEDDGKNISLCPESEDDKKLAYSGEKIQIKMASKEQLPIKESVGDAQKKDEKDSVALTSNTGKDTVDNSSLQRLKTAEDAKLANSQQKMQSKLDAIEQLPTNSGVECVPAKDKDDSVAVTNNTKDDNVKSSSICFERKEDSKLAQQEMQSKLECGGVSEAEIKQLPPTEPVKDAPAAKEDGDSVVNKNNTKDENLKFTSVYQETEEAARLENVQEEMPSKAGNDTKQLIGERYVKDAPTLDDEIGNDDVIKSFSHLKAEDVDFNLAIYHKELQREVNEEVKSHQGYTFNQTDMKHDYIEEVPEIRNPVSSSLDLVENEGCFESMQHDTKYIDGSLKQIEQGRANEEPHAYVNDGLQGLEEHLTIASREKITNAEFQEKLKNIQEQPKPYTTVSLIPNTKDCMIKSTEENIHMTNANKTCLLEEKYQEKFQAYDVPDVDADIYASTENNLSEKSDESCIKNKQAAPFHSIKTRENVNDEEHPIPIQNVPRTELWYSNYQNCTYFDMEKPPVTYSQEMPNTEYPLDENERKIKELTFESRKKCSHGIISDSVPKLQSINAECISEHPQRTSENYLPHDLDVGSVKNGHQQSNTVRAYKDEYELDPIISKENKMDPLDFQKYLVH